MKTIDFCIPFVGAGLRYTEFLVSNLLAMATHPERISICLSVHSDTAIEIIKNSPLNKTVNRIVGAQSYTALTNESNHGESCVRGGAVGSANHCSAIQALFEQTTADVVIFSDHDMAFLIAGWDSKITEILETHDLCGVGYPKFTFPLNEIEFPELHTLSGCNYRYIPNLSFLAISRQCIDKHFPQGISSFHHYLANGGLPFQIVNTVQMANTLHLPLGCIWWMDSGFEIPFVIQDKNLRYQTFIPVMFDKQTVFASDMFTESLSTGNLPTVFIDSVTGEPLLAHYGRGTLKANLDNNASFDHFMAAVNGYLAKCVISL